MADSLRPSRRFSPANDRATPTIARLTSAAADLLGAFTAERRLYGIEAEGELGTLQVAGTSPRSAPGRSRSGRG